MRHLLYSNDIGYREIEGQLYIRRVYRLPALLFPTETFTTRLLTDYEKTKEVLQDDDALLREITSAGLSLSSSSLSDLQAQLQSSLSHTTRSSSTSLSDSSSSDYRSNTGGNSLDLSSLDALLRDYDQDENTKNMLNIEENNQDDKIEIDNENDDHINIIKKENIEEEEEEEEKRRPVYHTVLEKERDAYLKTLEYESWEEARDEDNLSGFYRERMDNQILVRARCAVEYEEKEAARRQREWERRGVWLEGFPSEPLQLL
eukprot:CAMPEP_0182438582 /NCGR_PEP_ID=MMETSP1167-20130531/85875_1 /TAXON_ID=2988 /ORGANISM="Mallomonas Sp, Strain CCMP3275" /LENGTH=259 /DNA_ID=CAMNT_0024632013 /DNA_START=248 /DNA_END=1027 /DNA_ORIENTATION=+